MAHVKQTACKSTGGAPPCLHLATKAARAAAQNRVVYRFYTGSLAGIGIDIPYTGAGWSVFWLVFLALKNLAGTLKGLAGNSFFLKMGAGPLKKRAVTPL
jgi:hypothetical protein